MLPPHLRTIIKQIDQAIDKADIRANDRGQRADESQKESQRAIVTAIKSITDELKAYQGKQEDAERGKRRRENWTIAILFATVLVTIGLAVIGALQWHTLENTDQTLKDTLESKRPWIGFMKDSFLVAKKLSIDDDGARLTIKLTVRNGGDSAARGVSTIFQKLNIGPLPTSAEQIVASYGTANPCGESAVREKYHQGELILPNQDIPLATMEFFVPKSDFIGDTKTAWITGCVGYRGTSKRAYATTFTYFVDGEVLERVPGLSSGAY